jgi:hypothetical protein
VREPAWRLIAGTLSGVAGGGCYQRGASRLLRFGVIRILDLPAVAQAPVESISQRARVPPAGRAEALAASACEACSARRS